MVPWAADAGLSAATDQIKVGQHQAGKWYSPENRPRLAVPTCTCRTSMYMATSANASQSAPLVASTCQSGSQGMCQWLLHICTCECACMPMRHTNKEKKAQDEAVTGRAASSITGMGLEANTCAALFLWLFSFWLG